jgi:hypothetical protein
MKSKPLAEMHPNNFSVVLLFHRSAGHDAEAVKRDCDRKAEDGGQ